MRALLVAALLVLFGCKNECEKRGQDMVSWRTGDHVEFMYVPDGSGNLSPITYWVDDYAYTCVERKRK
jgi:hypothetical protein